MWDRGASCRKSFDDIDHEKPQTSPVFTKPFPLASEIGITTNRGSAAGVYRFGARKSIPVAHIFNLILALQRQYRPGLAAGPLYQSRLPGGSLTRPKAQIQQN
jgi:hypothetical protein